MKKIYLLINLLAFNAAFGQVDRLVLLEHFTQASCPPCAQANPRVDAIVDENPDKVVAIKYQVSWPGYDPMYEHNMAEVDNRVAYYNIVGVPWSVLDGNFYNGTAEQWDETTLDARRNLKSPFKIEVTHQLSPLKDSITAFVTITAVQDVISSALKAHVAVIERHIHFDTPPGTNGEKEFSSVMKKMLPSIAGTTLPGTWAKDDVQTFTLSWKLKNIYDMSQLGIVAFVQDNTTKETLQAGYSSPLVVGVAEQKASLPYKAYFNAGSIRVKLDQPMDHFRFNLYTVSGQLVASELLNGRTELTIPATMYPAGIYMASLSDPSGVLVSPVKLHIAR